MKKLPFFKPLVFVITVILSINTISHAQITGNAGPTSVDPVTPTIVDPTITVGGSVDLTDATVQINANFYNGDILSFDAGLAGSFGISGNYVTTDVSGILTFTGTTSPANWQAIFRTVTYENGSASCGPSSRTINFLQGNLLYNSYNGHYYEFVNENLNWKDAKAAAASRTFNGLQGYLATPTSTAENNFIWKLISADAWIGGSYDVDEINAATGTTTFADQNAAIGHVYWVTGPERGTYVSSDLFNPVSQGGQYMNWAGGEPNNYGDEFYVELYSGNEGKWNDLPVGVPLPYLVEYGGMPDDVPQDNTFTTSLTLTSTIGGDITGGDVSVCAGSNSTTLTTTAEVSGVTIVRWESSIDNFLTPGIAINNTTNTLTVDNLTETTYFRSIANGNSCAEAPSSSAKITVGNTLPGLLATNYPTLCNNSVAQLTLSGYSGNILKWQTSPDNSSWSDIAATAGTYYTPSLTTGDYFYRAEIQSPACPASVFSNSVQVTVTADAGSVGGTLSGAQNACSPANSGDITVSGYTGSVIKWQSSTNNGISWSDIAITDDTYTFTNITTTTKYRAVIQNAACNPVNSTPITVVYSSGYKWIGITSTDFGTAGNWTCSVPAPGADITISSTAPYMPVLDQDRTIGNITFENNTNININGHELTIEGVVNGDNTGSFTGSTSSSLKLTGDGNTGTLYFDQSDPGGSDHLNAITINKNATLVATPPSTPICTPNNYGGFNGAGITNVTFGSINNSTPTYDIGYNNYFDNQSTDVDPSTDYNLSITTGDDWGDQGIKIWIDWNNNGTFGDDPNEIITAFDGGPWGTYNFTVSVPAIGGLITGGSKTMRILVDDYTNMMYNPFDACTGEFGEFEDYKINVLPLPVLRGGFILGNDLSISNSLTLTKGIINTGSNVLIMEAGSTASGISDSSHVNGNVRKIGNTAFTFPVGDGIYYAPISMSAPADIADHFTASYTKADPLPVYNNTNYGNDIISISSNEYWILNRTNGNSNVNVTLSWNAARSSAIPNIGQVRVSRWDGLMWTNAGNANLTTGDLTAGTVTSNTVTDFSPFTIGIGSSILPVNLLNFTAARNNKQVNLNWQTSAEINSSRFDIERSGNNNIWIKIGEVQGQGNSNRLSDYRFADASPLSGNNYYRLKMVDIDGQFIYSPVRLVNFTLIQSSSVYPNPFTGNITIDAGSNMIGNLFVIDMNGKVVYRATIKKTRETINLSHLAAGQYTVLDNGNYFKVIKMR